MTPQLSLNIPAIVSVVSGSFDLRIVMALLNVLCSHWLDKNVWVSWVGVLDSRVWLAAL